MSPLLRWFLHIFEKLPLIGGLVNCSGRDFWEALEELFSKLLVSLSPILVWIFYVYLSGQETSFLNIVISTVRHGELFLYCTSLLAPIFYMALHERRGSRTFPNKLSHMLLVLLIISCSVLFFFLYRKGEPLDPRNVFNMSMVFYLVSVMLIYIATVYKNSTLSPPDEFQRQENDFSKQYNNHRR